MKKNYKIFTASVVFGIIILFSVSCYKHEKQPNVLVISFNGLHEKLTFNNALSFNRTYKASPDNNIFKSSVISGKYVSSDNFIKQTAELFEGNDYITKFIGKWGNCSKSIAEQIDKIPLEEVSPYKPFAFFITYDYQDSTSQNSQRYEIEKLLSKLKAFNMLDNTILFVSYNENSSNDGMKESDIKISSELIYPLLINDEKSANYLISSADILPTIADLCNLQKVDFSRFDGISLEPFIKDENIPSRNGIAVIDSMQKSIITSDWKYIKRDDLKHNSDDTTFVAEELYNLDTDPSEQNNLASQTRFISKKVELMDLLDNIGLN